MNLKTKYRKKYRAINNSISKGGDEMEIKKLVFENVMKMGKAKQKYEHKRRIPIDIKAVRKEVGVINKLVGFLQPMRKGASIREERLNSVNSWVIDSPQKTNRVILYFHGGGYFFSLKNLSNLFKYFLPEVANACDAQVWAPDYRVAPENPFPASLDDAYEAYQELLNRGIKPEDIFVMGDSAGGGLSLALLLKLKNEGQQLPRGAIVLSPWSDLSLTGDSIKSRADKEIMFYSPRVPAAVGMVVGQDQVLNPYISPVYGDYKGFPPLMIVVGGREIFYDDSTRIGEKAKKAGVKVTLDIQEEMVHTYPVFGGIYKEGKEALDRIAKFINENS
jgi:acetyl esterase/lipase